MNGLLVAAHLHVRTGDIAAEPGERGIVATYIVEDEATDTPTVRWDVTTNLGVGPDSRSAVRQLGTMLHSLAHTLLAEGGALLDLTPPADEADPDREHDERAANGGA
ncbi:hypothetical protein [Cellulomonas sp.]|uniref:hypothetical protein n=1 Tax=Cellulomonas sp. TaxID=40001 RepID=UPI001B119A03|nr:hypothetical protein [Cellulomonas sp.]MBO9556741.1 hypothetical protein [Cellulomonas sp.]